MICGHLGKICGEENYFANISGKNMFLHDLWTQG